MVLFFLTVIYLYLLAQNRKNVSDLRILNLSKCFSHVHSYLGDNTKVFHCFLLIFNFLSFLWEIVAFLHTCRIPLTFTPLCEFILVSCLLFGLWRQEWFYQELSFPVALVIYLSCQGSKPSRRLCKYSHILQVGPITKKNCNVEYFVQAFHPSFTSFSIIFYSIYYSIIFHQLPTASKISMPTDHAQSSLGYVEQCLKFFLLQLFKALCKAQTS